MDLTHPIPVASHSQGRHGENAIDEAKKGGKADGDEPGNTRTQEPATNVDAGEPRETAWSVQFSTFRGRGAQHTYTNPALSFDEALDTAR